MCGLKQAISLLGFLSSFKMLYSRAERESMALRVVQYVNVK